MSVEPTGILRSQPGAEGVQRVADRSRSQRVDESHATETDQPSALVTSELRRYLAAGRSPSPERAERVTALRAAIASGRYEVSIEALAKKLLGDER